MWSRNKGKKVTAQETGFCRQFITGGHGEAQRGEGGVNFKGSLCYASCEAELSWVPVGHGP